MYDTVGNIQWSQTNLVSCLESRPPTVVLTTSRPKVCQGWGGGNTLYFGVGGGVGGTLIYFDCIICHFVIVYLQNMLYILYYIVHNNREGLWGGGTWAGIPIIACINIMAFYSV